MIKKILNNSYVFSVLAKLFSVFVGIVYSIFYSRYLGAELRGTASIINNYAEILSLVFCLGAFQAYPYFKKKYGKDIYEDFINNVFALIGIFYLLIIPLIFILGIRSNLAIGLLIAPMWMGGRQLNYVVLVENPRLSNMATIIQDTVDFILIAALMIFTKANFRFCVLIVTFKQAIYFIICLKNIYFRKFSFHPTLRGIFPYISYGIVPMITLILMEINYKIDVLMLEWFSIPTAAIGIYSLGVMLAQKVWMIPDALKDILLSKLVAGKDSGEVARISRISFTITICCELMLVILGKPLIRLMYGAEYEDSYFITLIICAGVVGMVFYKMIYSYNVANGHKNANLLLLLISALLNVVFNAVTIPFIGTYGAAAASLISYLMCGIGFLIFFKSKTGIKISEAIIIKKEDLMFFRKILKK